MKRFTKILSAVCMTTLLVVSLTACNNDGDGSDENDSINIEGTWKKTVNTLVVKVDLDLYNTMVEKNPVKWTINSDGTIEIESTIYGGSTETKTASWTLNDNKLTIIDDTKPEGSKVSTFTYSREDGNIYYDAASEEYYRFEKQ